MKKKKNVLETISLGGVLKKSTEESLLLSSPQENLIDIFEDFFGGLGSINVIMNSLQSIIVDKW